MKIRIAALLILTTSIFINSCSNKPDKSDKFIGTWQNMKEQKLYFTIAKEDTNIILQVHFTGLEAKSDHGPSRKYSATYNKEQDKLELNTEDGKKDIDYVQASQHLLTDGQEFQKVNEPPSFKEDAKRADSEAVIQKAIQSSSFEDDVIKMANFKCEKQKLKAKDPSDEKVKKELNDLQKEIDFYNDEMTIKYKDKKNDSAMNARAMQIMKGVMDKCQ